MKRHFNKLFILLGVVMTLGGCSKDYLEDPKPAGSVSEDVVFNSRAGVEAYISGIHRRARAQFTNTDAAGLNSIYYARVVKGNDIIQGPTWFLYDYENDNREPTYRRTIFTWEFSYFMINQLNTLINGVEASQTLSPEEKADLKGQGLALRAFYYFQLAMEFQQTYTYDSSLPAPPIYLELSLEGKPMSTLEEMYTLIVSDLTTAIDGLTDARLDKSYVNKSVAQGFLARVYLVMENWEGAEKMAHAAYGGDVQAALDPEWYDNGFDDTNSPEVMWALIQYPDQTNYYWGAPAAQADHRTTSYYGMYVNDDFVQTFAPTDVRNLFVHMYTDDPTDYRYWVTNKFEFTFDADFITMRTPEMILIEAEALYHQGGAKEDQAHDLLFQLQQSRIFDDPETEDVVEQAVKSNNTGADLFEEILLERRKELYGEIGVEWFDAKRLQRGITRTGNHRVFASLQPNDPNFYLKIPQAEIDANDAIDASVNANR
ncbi:MAG: RagB/SusD family nutrient uptake outer membrane protein [Salinimicrobium sp.]